MSGSSRSSSSMACRRLDTNFCWLRSFRRQRGNAVNGTGGIGAPGLFTGLSSSSVIRSSRSLHIVSATEYLPRTDVIPRKVNVPVSGEHNPLIRQQLVQTVVVPRKQQSP